MSLEYTGERMLPEQAGSDTFWEHIYRYRFAVPFAPGRRVLDIACGEGYGTAALERAGAASVIGVDVSPEACAHAERRYGIKALVGDATAIPLPASSVDLVVSFETIEHLDAPEAFLEECARVLTPEGTLVISTPNRGVYGQEAVNPFHLKELSEPEFREVLGRRWKSVEYFAQSPQTDGWLGLGPLASPASPWNRRRGFRHLRWRLQRQFCPEIVSPEKLADARRDPIASILARSSPWAHIANPFAIRPHRAGATLKPLYLLAVATNQSA